MEKETVVTMQKDMKKGAKGRKEKRNNRPRKIELKKGKIL